MYAALNPIQQLFFGVSVVAIVMIATVVYMVSSSNYKNTDRLEKSINEITKGLQDKKN
tara:strand:+ start:134 stop:307 length:174 start_codon:yes stop_codon:yes gene_type:complete